MNAFFALVFAVLLAGHGFGAPGRASTVRDYLDELAGGASPSDTERCGRLKIWRLPDHFAPTEGASDSLEQRAQFMILRTKAVVSLIAAAAERWCVEQGRGRYPASLAALLAYSNRLSLKASCRVDASHYFDPWGRPIFYGLSGGVPVIVSAGPDGRFSTQDDITLPKPGDKDAVPIQARASCAIARSEEGG